MADDTLALIQADTGISERERRFADGLMADPEMSVAAGEAAAGLAKGQGAAILKQPNVRQYISAALMSRRARYADIRDAVIHGLYSLATYDIADAIGADGLPLAPNMLPDKIRDAVKGARMGRYGWEYTFVDKAQIRMQLSRHFGDSDKFLESAAGAGRVAEVERVKIKYYDVEE